MYLNYVLLGFISSSSESMSSGPVWYQWYFPLFLSSIINGAFFEKLFCVRVTLYLRRIHFNVIGLEPSTIPSLKLSRLTQWVKRCFEVIVWLWHSSHSGGMGRHSILYPWVSDVWPVLSLLIIVSSFLHLLFSFQGRVLGLISLSFSFFWFYSVFHFWCMASLIYGNRSW